MPTVAQLLTAEEYARLPEDGRRTELVRGEILETNIPRPRHGQLCSRIDRRLGTFAETQGLGHVVANDTGFVTSRDPDTVRGPDLAYISYAKVPKGPLPADEYLEVAPEIVIEILSPTDRWADVLRKGGEYLSAGVEVVCVVDFEDEAVHLYYDRKPSVVLRGGDLLTFPEQLPGFSLPLTELFE